MNYANLCYKANKSKGREKERENFENKIYILHNWSFKLDKAISSISSKRSISLFLIQNLREVNKDNLYSAVIARNDPCN